MSVLAARPAVAGRRDRPARALLYAALLLLAGFYLLPVFAIVVASLKTFAEASQSTLWELSKAPTLDAYSRALTQLAPNFVNSVFLAVPATLISAFLGSMNGYVLAKWRFRGANLLFTLLLFGMFIPYQSVLIPLVKFLQIIHLYGGIPGLILAHVVYGIPICTLIFRNYYAGLPTELVEAGRIDGASVLGVYRYILFPISIPGFVVVIAAVLQSRAHPRPAHDAPRARSGDARCVDRREYAVARDRRRAPGRPVAAAPRGRRARPGDRVRA